MYLYRNEEIVQMMTGLSENEIFEMYKRHKKENLKLITKNNTYLIVKAYTNLIIKAGLLTNEGGLK